MKSVVFSTKITIAIHKSLNEVEEASLQSGHRKQEKGNFSKTYLLVISFVKTFFQPMKVILGYKKIG